MIYLQTLPNKKARDKHLKYVEGKYKERIYLSKNEKAYLCAGKIIDKTCLS